MSFATACKVNLCALENILSPDARDTQLSVVAAQHGQLSSIRDPNEPGNAEESKGGGDVCQSARCADVLLRLMHIHVAIFGNDEKMSHGEIRVCVSQT